MGSWLPFGKGNTESAVAANIKMIEIDLSSVNATIIPEKRDDIKADLDGKGKVNINKSGNKIRIEYEQNLLDGIQFLNHTSELNIYIPEDYDQSMAVDVGSGYLQFDGSSMELDELKIDLSSGKIDLTNMTTEKFVNKGSSGMIDINKLVTKAGTIDMSSGIIKVKNYQGALDASVSSGQLNIQIDKLVDDLNVKASSGQIKLDLPDGADFTFNGKASSGFIDCDLPLTNKITDEDKIEGVSGSGKHSVDVNITSGLAKIF